LGDLAENEETSSLIVCLAASGSVAASAVSCESLASTSLPHTTITSAVLVTSGMLATDREQLRDLPALCRVTATSRPSRNSAIKIEVWLPAAGWNGKFQPGKRLVCPYPSVATYKGSGTADDPGNFFCETR
jgi:hypothetical protein